MDSKLKDGIVRTAITGAFMRRTITLSVMWQVDPLTQEAVEPTQDYKYGGDNCFSAVSAVCLVEVFPFVYAGHVDSDRTQGDDQHLGVYKGEPMVVAQRLWDDYLYLNTARTDGLAVPVAAAEAVVWQREFLPAGGKEISAQQLLRWIHPATKVIVPQ